MNDKKQLMKAIYEYGFAMDEAILYLDTHPCDEKAMDYYNLMQKQYRSVYDEYQRKFGPLNARDVDDDNMWSWVKAPWPWEMEGC